MYVKKSLLFHLAVVCAVLTTSLFIYPRISLVSAQGPGEVLLFSDNFSSGNADAWQLTRAGGGSATDLWQVEKEADGNWVLSSKEHTWGIPVNQGKWSDFTFKTRVKLMQGSTQGVHLNYRLGISLRYFIAFHPGSVYLGRTMPAGTHTNVASVAERHEIGRWYSVEIVGKGSRIQVFVDGVLKIDFNDPTPVLSGGIGIETLDGSHVHIDDIAVIGPPPAPAPAGLSGFAWTFTGGPRGGIGYDVRIHPLDPSVLWVTDAYAGTHRSTDGGLTWEAMNSGITARTGYSGDTIPIFSLTIDPNRPDIIWAGTQGMRGVFKTTDSGKTWKEKVNGVEEHPVTEIRSFTVDPHDSNIVYMGGNYRPDPRKLEERGFIYRTTDGGEKWTKILEPGALVRWIIVDPTDSNTIYASTGIFDRIAVKPEGILKSTDGGRTWFRINDGLTSLSVGGLVMHPRDPKTLFATTGKASAFLNEERELYGAVFKTTDGGQHWRKVYPTSGPTRQVRYSAVAFAPSDPNIVYVDAGHEFLRSTNDGESWQRFDVSAQTMKGEWRGTPIALAVHPQNPNIIYMNAYDGGVFRSEDGGRTWVDASAGYSGSQSWDIAVDPSNPAHVVVATKSGVHTSHDGAQTWQGRVTDGWVNNVLSVAIDPAAPETFLVGSEISGFIGRTMDGGAKWQEVLPPLGVDTPAERISIYQIVFAPSQPSMVYAATGIAALTIGFNKDISGRGVYKSVDGGRNWLPVNQGLEAARLNILAIAVGPRDPDLVYAGTLDCGVFKSDNGGKTWVKASSGITASEIRSLAIDPTNSDIVYAGTENAALFKSVDGGRTWKSSSAGMEPEASVRSIVIDPSHPEIVYAADRRTGVYRSPDSGKTWTQINQGLRMRAANRLAISIDGKIFYAATEGGGVFRIGQPPVSPTFTPVPSPTLRPTPPAPTPLPPSTAMPPAAIVPSPSVAVPPRSPDVGAAPTSPSPTGNAPASTGQSSNWWLVGLVLALLLPATLWFGQRLRKRQR